MHENGCMRNRWICSGLVSILHKIRKKHIFRIPPGKCGLYHTGSHATLSEVYLLLLESSFILEVSGLHIPGLSTSDIAMCDYKILPSSDYLFLDFISSSSFITTSFFCSTLTWFLRKTTWRKSFLLFLLISKSVFSQSSSQIKYLDGIRILGGNSFLISLSACLQCVWKWWPS